MRPPLLSAQGVVLLAVLAAVCLAAFYTWVYRREARRLTRNQQRLLRVLRIAVAALALLALVRPALTLVRHDERLPVVALLVDESTSMAFPDARDNPLVQASPRASHRRYDTAQSVAHRLQAKLTRTHRVQVFTFSDS